jgi:hypothetical protein
MGLLEDIMGEPTRKSRLCSVKLLMDHLDKKDRDDLETALDDVMIQSTIIARVLERKGHKIPHTAIARHRRAGCACE